jgi:hypothetical protein
LRPHCLLLRDKTAKTEEARRAHEMIVVFLFFAGMMGDLS